MAASRTLRHEVGKIEAVIAPGVTSRWLIVAIVLTNAGRITYRHAEAFDCEDWELEPFILQMLDEAKLCADAQHLEILEARTDELRRANALIQSANA